ncbi:MAG: porin family protein [Ignavibacteria bacterium]|jgi:opacity protein-like surface antigen|nr:porin family protein [Ignavibacteria bacterium]MCU7504436.1 porin family protein [Ignavibacteria bacterium]MCU7517473.1 porin family protein [Ignavibacteria bacterium]
MKRVLTVFAFFLTCFSTVLYSQNIKYGFGGGLTYVLGPSSYTNDIDTSGSGLGLKSGYHLEGKIKFGLDPLPLRLTGQLIYTSISGSKDNIIVNPTTAIDLETSTSIFTVAFGAEYLFNKQSSLSPYANLELQMNAQGKTNFNKVYPNGTQEFSSDSRARWGLGIGAGVDVGLMSQLDLDAGIKFNFVNLFGKMSDESGFNTFTLTLVLLYHQR